MSKMSSECLMPNFSPLPSGIIYVVCKVLFFVSSIHRTVKFSQTLLQTFLSQVSTELVKQKTQKYKNLMGWLRAGF